MNFIGFYLCRNSCGPLYVYEHIVCAATTTSRTTFHLLPGIVVFASMIVSFNLSLDLLDKVERRNLKPKLQR